MAEKKGFWGHLGERFAKTRHNLVGGLTTLFSQKKGIDEEVLQEIEDRLLLADAGMSATDKIVEALRRRNQKEKITDLKQALVVIQQEIHSLLLPCQIALEVKTEAKPFVILMIGINGAGKTSTAGKLAAQFVSEGRSVLLAAGDTFRAAAVEQLRSWGKQCQVPVVFQDGNADSASVIHDAMCKAQAAGSDILIADTAGRLHNREGLMRELEKIKRVLGKLDAKAPHEVLLVIDANNGQNALQQAKEFHRIMGVTGIVITKLDGSAKGGIMLAIARELGLAIRFLGVGEKPGDLKAFDAEWVSRSFVEEPS